MRETTITTLLVEDDPEDALLLTKMMGDVGWPSLRFACECVESLGEALKAVEKGEFAVILLDLMLPDSQGVETVRRMRAKVPDIPIVVLTGLRDEALGLEAVAQGAQDYQVKGSVDGHALKRTISYAVERHRSLARLRNVVDRALDAIVVVDARGQVVYANPVAEQFFSSERSSLLGLPFPHALPPPNRYRELRFARTDGTQAVAEIRTSPTDWNDAPATLATIRDITELRRIEQLKAEIVERRRVDKLKDELMNAVSHEMRSPLTIIRAAVSNLQDGLTGELNEKQSQMVHLASTNTIRLTKILDNILDLARLESGRAQIRRQRLGVGGLIRDAAHSYRLVAAGKKIEIIEDLSSGLPSVNADPELIMQVLGNLIDNALRFTRTRVTLRAAPSAGGLLRVSVIDDGPGIPADSQGELFNKFVQLDRQSCGGGYHGTGLGLAICKEIIERHDGRIWIESQARQGAAFHFELPLFAEAPRGRAAGASSGDERSGSGSK